MRACAAALPADAPPVESLEAESGGGKLWVIDAAADAVVWSGVQRRLTRGGTERDAAMAEITAAVARHVAARSAAAAAEAAGGGAAQ